MDFKEIDQNWTLFLDRDGVINVRKMGGYILSPSEFEFLPGVLEAICFFKNKFQKIIVVTNQQGIGKGLMTECNLNDIHRYMCEEVVKNNGKIDACFFAPDIKSETNLLRKPNPGMAILAKNKFPEIDFTKSIMVGDTDTDIVFGKNLGMKTIRIKTVETINIEADLTVNSLLELKELWVKSV
jgi:histidinol-phosphate phosphatase family protein